MWLFTMSEVKGVSQKGVVTCSGDTACWCPCMQLQSHVLPTAWHYPRMNSRSWKCHKLKNLKEPLSIPNLATTFPRDVKLRFEVTDWTKMWASCLPLTIVGDHPEQGACRPPALLDLLLPSFVLMSDALDLTFPDLNLEMEGLLSTAMLPWFPSDLRS